MPVNSQSPTPNSQDGLKRLFQQIHQPAPMQLRRVTVVDDMTVHGKAVFGLWIDLDPVTNSRLRERVSKPNLLLGGKACVNLRRTDVHKRTHLRREPMRAVR